MRLEHYLKQRGLSAEAFARTAKIPARTMRRLARGEGASIPTASRIVWASRGRVSYRELGPAGVRLAPRPKGERR